MRRDVLPLLICPVCHSADLRQLVFAERGPDEIAEGVLWCANCRSWFPVQDGVLDLLTGALSYPDDREHFWEAHAGRLEQIGLSRDPLPAEGDRDLQLVQQRHFDWYARNDLQTYNEYEHQPFWLAADRLAFDAWRTYIAAGTRLLDVGCAEGRSTFKIMDLGIDVIGFDVSKVLVGQAMRRYQAGSFKAKATFCAADAIHFPFRDSSFDYVLVYGVLHHLPDPVAACKEIARVLKPNGRYLGSENNRSALRGLFDVLQQLSPLWHEEAGPEALISSELIREAFRATGVDIQTHTSVFVPPHLANRLSEGNAYYLLSVTDRIGQAIPILRDNGGLLIINGIKAG